jgi:hypothetical protein
MRAGTVETMPAGGRNHAAGATMPSFRVQEIHAMPEIELALGLESTPASKVLGGVTMSEKRP